MIVVTYNMLWQFSMTYDMKMLYRGIPTPGYEYFTVEYVLSTWLLASNQASISGYNHSHKFPSGWGIVSVQ